MKYTKVSIKTTTDAVDFISNLFDEIGLEGIQIEDNIPLSEEDKKAMYIDILPELPEDDGTATVSSYFEEGTFQIDELRKQIEEGLEEIAIFVNIGDGTIEISDTDDKDWINNWKEFFKPFRVADDIVIKPTWEELDDKKEGDKQWWISLIIGILFLTLGVAVAILYNIEVLKNIIMIIFGATLIFEGIMGFVFVFILHKVIRLNFAKKENDEQEDTETEDLDEVKEVKAEKEKSQKLEEDIRKIKEKNEKAEEKLNKTAKTESYNPIKNIKIAL